MLADLGLVMHGLLLVAVVALLAAVVCAFPLIWADLRRDLDDRVRADAQPGPGPYNQDLDLDWRDLIEREDVHA